MEQVEHLAAPPSDGAAAVLALIERVALDPGADAAKLESIVAMYQQLKAKEAELAFNGAKGRILKKLAGIKLVKNRPALYEIYEIDKGKSQKRTYEAFKYAPLDTSGGKSTVQGVGSTNSYLRRYIACNIFNIVVVGDDDDGNGGTIDEAQTSTLLELIKKAKVGPKFLKYMRAQSIGKAGSLEAAVATIASRDYRKAVTTLEEQIAKAEASHASLS